MEKLVSGNMIHRWIPIKIILISDADPHPPGIIWV
jgi:hypothetical protein